MKTTNLKAELTARLQTVAQRAKALKQTIREAAEIRSSDKLSAAAGQAWTFGPDAEELASAIAADSIQLDEATAQTQTLEQKIDAFTLPKVIGLAHDDPRATHFCITASKSHGYGIFSAHDNKGDALYNATITGGKCSAIDRSEDGKIIISATHREALRIAAEYC